MDQEIDTTDNIDGNVFDELIMGNPDVCSNCFRKIRDRYQINLVNVKGEAHELRRSTEKIVRTDNDYNDSELADFVESDETCENGVPYCECGIVLPGFETERPLSKAKFLENRNRLVDRLEEVGLDFDRDEFREYCYQAKTNPDNQFCEHRIYRHAIDHVIDVQQIRADGGVLLNKSRCIDWEEFKHNEVLRGVQTDDLRPSVDEEDLQGQLVHDVPQIDPETVCNARLHNNRYQFLAYCNEEHDGDRCPNHDHEPRWKSKDKLKDNQFAQKHGLYSDPEKYFENMSEKEKTEIEEIQEAILDRMRQDGEIDAVDRKMAKSIAVRSDIAEDAAEYVKKKGLTQTVWTENGSHQKKNPILTELRLYDSSVIDDMRKLGNLDDPETKKADSLSSWREYIEDGEDE